MFRKKWRAVSCGKQLQIHNRNYCYAFLDAFGQGVFSIGRIYYFEHYVPGFNHNIRTFKNAYWGNWKYPEFKNDFKRFLLRNQWYDFKFKKYYEN